jgi:hypothetical protein
MASFMHDFMAGPYDSLFDIMDLVMVPWGNAQVSHKG